MWTCSTTGTGTERARDSMRRPDHRWLARARIYRAIPRRASLSLRVMRTVNRNERPGERTARCRCSDSGDDLDPSLVHRLEPLSLLLRILVWDGADEVVAPAVLVDLARCGR